MAATDAEGLGTIHDVMAKVHAKGRREVAECLPSRTYVLCAYDIRPTQRPPWAPLPLQLPPLNEKLSGSLSPPSQVERKKVRLLNC